MHCSPVDTANYIAIVVRVILRPEYNHKGPAQTDRYYPTQARSFLMAVQLAGRPKWAILLNSSRWFI